MAGIKHRLLGLCLPPLVLYALDTSLTLFGQSASYWAGNYRHVNEASPTFNLLLQVHPAAFVIGSLVWATLFVGVILLLPDFFALIASITVTFGHTVGAATWMIFRFRYEYQTLLGLLFASSIILGTGVYWGWQVRPVSKYPLSNWSPLLRWTLILGLVGIAVYLFLWPHKL